MDKEDKKLLMNTIAWAIGIAAVFIMLLTIVSPDVEPKNKFEVVDKYQGCDVVQYTRSNLSHYIYFLDCRE